MTARKRQKTPKIIKHFATELSHIFAEYVTNIKQDDTLIPLTDRFAVKLILTLNKRYYQRELLFRDYQQENINYQFPDGSCQSINGESIFYVQEVLVKRLSIVSKQKSLPNNIHRLLLMLCRYNVNDNWKHTRIKRKKTLEFTHDLFFKPFATILQKQYQQLTTINSYSQNCQQKYGTLRVILGKNNAKLAEEISLFDVLSAVPKPVSERIKTQATWYIPLIERILSSLNGCYGLLRSCGLIPQYWHGRLSDGKLRDLKKLKMLADEYLKSGEIKDNSLAFQQAFIVIQKKQNKIAGFVQFNDFVISEIGQDLLKRELVDFNNTEHNLNETIAAPEIFSVELENGLESLLTNHSKSFSLVDAYFFKQVLILQRSLYGETGVFADSEFRQLLANDKTYAHLEGEILATKLVQKIKRIIQKHQSQ